jgi:hypothetical protein
MKNKKRFNLENLIKKKSDNQLINGLKESSVGILLVLLLPIFWFTADFLYLVSKGIEIPFFSVMSGIVAFCCFMFFCLFIFVSPFIGIPLFIEGIAFMFGRKKDLF